MECTLAPKIVDKEAKRTEIIHAALIVFAEKGVAKAKMIDIAEKAGIGKGTIYEYFRSKEEIFASGFRMFFETLQQDLSAAIESTSDPEQQLRLIVEGSLQGIKHYGSDFAGVMMDFWAEGIRSKNDALLSAIDMPRMYEEFRRLLRGILENGIRKGVFRPLNTLNTAAALIGALDGVLLQWIMNRELINMESVAETLLDSYLNGIKSR